MTGTTNAEKSREIGHLFAQSLVEGVRAEQCELEKLGVPIARSHHPTVAPADDPALVDGTADQVEASPTAPEEAKAEVHV